MTVKSAQAVVVEFTTANPTTAAAANADSLPAGTLYVNGVANAATVTVANVTTGVYTASVTLPALSAGDVVGIRIAATVATVAGQAIVWQDVADTTRTSDTYAIVNDGTNGNAAIKTAVGDVHATDLPAVMTMLTDIHGTDLPAVKADTAAVKTKTDNLPADTNTLLVTTGIKAASIPAATLAANQDVRNVSGTLPDVALAASQPSYAPAKAGDKMDLVDAPNATGVGVIAAAVRDLATSGLAALKAILDAIKTVTDKFAFTTANQVDARVLTNSDKTGYALTTAPPTVADIWNYALASMGAETTIGGRIKAFLTSLVYAAPPAAAPSAADNATAVWGAGTKALTDKAGFSLATAPPTAAAISTAVWGETVRSLTTFGTLVADAATAVWAAATRTLSAFGFTPNAGNMVAAPDNTNISKIAALIETDGGHDRFRATALETAPSGGGSGITVADILDHDATGHTTADTVGARLAAIVTGATSAADAHTDAHEALTRLPDATPGTANGLPLKSDLPAAAPDATAVQTAAAAALTAYDPPTRTEATSDKETVIAAMPSVAALATEANATANRNTVVAAIGGGEVVSGTKFDETSEDTNGDVIGITTPGATIRAYAAADTTLATAFRRTTANANGTWRIYLEPDADYLLAFTKDGYYDAAGGDSVLTVEVTS
jgi:hypothetical protein